MGKEGYLTKELIQQTTERMIEEEKKSWIFRAYYWDEVQKQYIIGCKMLESGEEISADKAMHMVIEAGQIAHRRTEEEWLEKQQQKQKTKK